MKTCKISILVICLIMVCSASFADEIKGKLIFRVGGAISLLSSSTMWSRSWQADALEVTQEVGDQSIEGDNAFLFNGSVAVFITPRFAIEGMFGYHKMDASVSSSYSETHYWWDDERTGPYGNTFSYSSEGSLSVVPININGLYQMDSWRSFSFYLSGGLSIAPCNFEADAFTGLVHYVTMSYPFLDVQIFDVIQDAQLRIDRSFTSVGFNIGGGADIKISSSLSVNIEARYIHLQKKNYTWGMRAGTYEGRFGRRWNFNEDFVRGFGNNYLTHALVVNPSIFSISGGITYRF